MRWVVHTVLLALGRREASVPKRRDARFALHALVLVLAGSLIASAASGLHPVAAGAIGFGVSIALDLLTVSMLYVSLRHGARACALVCAGSVAYATWTVIATAGPFAAGTARWLAFAGGIVYMFAGAILLVLHELSPNRVVHVLEVRELRPTS